MLIVFAALIYVWEAIVLVVDKFVLAARLLGVVLAVVWVEVLPQDMA